MLLSFDFTAGLFKQFIFFEMFKHPAKACMTYWSHFKFSMFLSKEFSKASVGAFIHAVYPDVLISHSRNTLSQLTKELNERGCSK